jgi:probable F420-dependent oxidoreductase
MSKLKIGLTFPQTEFASDAGAIREYAQTAEALGYSYILAYDHVLGANPERPGGWNGRYTYQSSFEEPLVLFSYMAALTQRIEFAPGIIILPQRQTALFATQAATLDVLCNGRLRVGVGLGWNQVEYAALNEDFHTRGRRIEEQVSLLRQLWTQPLVQFSGRWHNIPDAGLNPLPVQRPIPLWFGGTADAAIKRLAELGDGWMVNYRKPADALAGIQKVYGYIDAAGRAKASFGIDVRIPYGDGNPDAWLALIAEWQDAGATHLSLNTMGSGFDAPGKHLLAIRRFAEAVGLK